MRLGFVTRLEARRGTENSTLSKALLCAGAVLGMLSLFGCGITPNSELISRLQPLDSQPSDTNTHPTLFEQNTEGGGGSTSTHTSTSFKLGKTTIGGNYLKSKSTSATYHVTGGIYGGL